MLLLFVNVLSVYMDRLDRLDRHQSLQYNNIQLNVAALCQYVICLQTLDFFTGAAHPFFWLAVNVHIPYVWYMRSLSVSSRWILNLEAFIYWSWAQLEKWPHRLSSSSRSNIFFFLQPRLATYLIIFSLQPRLATYFFPPASRSTLYFPSSLA